MFESWFTNKCEAYVDANGDALSGKALEQARRNPNAPRCGHLVRIGAKCCMHCGALAPGRYWTCQSCGAKVSKEARICSECGAPQTLVNRNTFIDGIWRVPEGIFSQRFELNALKDNLRNGLDVQDGQAAILLLGGETQDVLPPGHYSLEDLLAPAQGKAVRCSLVMVRLGEQEFPVKLDGLVTSEHLDTSLKCLAFLQFDFEKAARFMSSLAGKTEYTDGDIQSCMLSFESIAFHILLPEIEGEVKPFCAQHKMADLFLEPELRIELEEAVKTSLESRLNSVGLRFCRLSGIDFAGDAYDELCKTQGELERTRRELEFQLKAETLAQDNEKQSAQADMEHEKFLKQLAQEMKISDMVRDQELAALRDKMALDNAIADLEAKYQKASKEQHDIAELEKLDAQHAEDLKAIVQDGEIARRQKEHAELLRQRLEEQKAALEVATLEGQMTVAAAEARHTADGFRLETKEKELKIEREDEACKVKNLNEASFETLLALVDDPVKAKMLLESKKLDQARDMSPEQIMATAVREGASGASQAFTAQANSKKNDDKEALERALRQNSENMQTVERIASKAMDAAAQAAKGNTTTTQVIK